MDFVNGKFSNDVNNNVKISGDEVVASYGPPRSLFIFFPFFPILLSSLHFFHYFTFLHFFFQAEDGIRDYYASRGLGDVYKRQCWCCALSLLYFYGFRSPSLYIVRFDVVANGCCFVDVGSDGVGDVFNCEYWMICLLYTSDAADD